MHEVTSEHEVSLPPMTLQWQCAWCAEERGELPEAGRTDGICRRHLREMRRKVYEYREWRWRHGLT